MSLSPSGEDLLLVEAVREDEGSAGTEAGFQKVSDCFPYTPPVNLGANENGEHGHCATRRPLSSDAPRPQIKSPSSYPPNGGCAQRSAVPGGAGVTS